MILSYDRNYIVALQYLVFKDKLVNIIKTKITKNNKIKTFTLIIKLIFNSFYALNVTAD